MRCEADRGMGRLPSPIGREDHWRVRFDPGLGVKQMEPAHIEVDRHLLHRPCSGRGVQASHKRVVPGAELDNHFRSQRFHHIDLGRHAFLLVFSRLFTIGDVFRSNAEDHPLIHVIAEPIDLALG